MKGKKLAIYICLSVLIIILSFVCYYGFSNIEKTSIQNVAFGSFIISEILFFIMIYIATKNNIFVKSGIISASAIYVLMMLVLNVFFRFMFVTVKTLITTNIILLILYFGIILLIYLAKKEK